MSFGSDRWKCARCGANNMPGVPACFRCREVRGATGRPPAPAASQGLPPRARRRRPAAALLGAGLALITACGLFAWRLSGPAGAAGHVPMPDEEAPPMPGAVRTPLGWKLPNGFTQTYQSDTRYQGIDRALAEDDALMKGVVMPCGDKWGGCDFGGGGPRVDRCIWGHRFVKVEGAFVPYSP